jgi:translation initiation factor 1 (eIF-1/SUI1)
MFNCMGSIKIDAKTSEEYIELSGDHREEVLQFLLYEGIATKDNVTKHGAEI